MWVLEAAFALYYWAMFANAVTLPELPDFAVLKSSWAAEMAWHEDAFVWGANRVEVERQWREKTGCCVAFSDRVWSGCLGENRVVYAKTLWLDSLKTVYVAANCGT